VDSAGDEGLGGGGQVFDLFGRAVEPLRERRGRPSYAKTVENQQFVETRAAAGWSQEAIALDMGISVETLTKYFSGELANGPIKVKGEMLDVLRSRARQGHVPSIRLLEEMTAKAQMRDRPKDKRVPALPVLGKKAQRVLEAQDKPAEMTDILSRLNGVH
jgi:transcriptional regulator with XRE-family HTH domain